MQFTGIQGLNNEQDINELKRLLAMGAISQQDLSDASISGQFGPPQNALAQMMQPQQQPSQEPPQGSNFVRNEQTGHVTYITPQGLSDAPSPPPGAGNAGPRMIAANAGPKQMNVVGSGNGTTVQLSPEDDKNVPLDYTRSPIDIPGVGRGYYGKDGNAYVTQNGQKTKVILGYDQQGSMALNKANMDMAQKQAEIAHTQEQTRASRANNPDLSMGGASPGDSGPLDAGTAATVQAMVEGRMAPPTGAALRNPRINQLINLANQVDPTFDATTWKRRADTASEFAHGKSFQSVNALNTVAGHLDTFDKAVDSLNNTNYPMVNAVENTVGQALGSTKQTNYQTVLKTLAPELERAYRGAGGSEGSIQQWQQALSGNNGYDQQKEAIRTLAGLLHSKIDALGNSYSQGMNKSSTGYDLLSPDAQKVFSKLTGMNAAPGGAEQASPPSAITDPAAKSKAVFEARQAIARGAPRDKVLARLQQAGISADGL